jgi:hypothetical protein
MLRNLLKSTLRRAGYKIEKLDLLEESIPADSPHGLGISWTERTCCRRNRTTHTRTGITAECDYYWLCRGLAVASFADLFLLPRYRKVLRS